MPGSAQGMKERALIENARMQIGMDLPLGRNTEKYLMQIELDQITEILVDEQGDFIYLLLALDLPVSFSMYCIEN